MWIPLSIGWLAAVAGLSPLLRLDQAGALLVCGAIVAEVLNDKKHRLFLSQVQPGQKSWHEYLEVDVPGESRKDIEIMPYQSGSGRTIVNTEGWSLYHLAKDGEFYNFENTRGWRLGDTMKRVESRLDYAVVASAIVGTVLWAFGADI